MPRDYDARQQFVETATPEQHGFQKSLSDDRVALKVVRRAELCKLAATGMTPGRIRETLGIEKGRIRRELMKSYERAGNLTEEEKQQLASLPPPATDGSVEHQVLQMREKGLGYDNIAFVLGIDPEAARRMFDEQIKRYHAAEMLDGDKGRMLHIRRTEKMLVALEQKILAGNVGAILAAVKVLERQARLLGLDAATRVNIEARLREAAREAGLDEEVVISEALTIIRREPQR